MIRHDQWFPEAYRTCALRGADIVCVPTNWVPIPGQDPNREAMENIIAMAAAHTNAVFVAAADRVSGERAQPFIGQNLIVGYTGWPVGGPASGDKEEIVLASVNVSDARKARRWNSHNQVVRDRRPDQYDERLAGARNS
jgi:predicted amidohydrolase